ncbi:Tad domain-containing protein [Erythrobacter aurantius]|uniref:Tad domain-containing protein n=1 Tax=Erythrobacter aurantius TaxID=2909249 RepID=UPI002079C977|nr:pilus assembly protein TadG-related protein [Erythrobacter aurantius]
MGHETERQSFFRRIAKDATANTMAISAASLVPLMAMVGGGVDASRYYMAESRLQAACDAGALAARRAMADDTFTTEHRTIGNQFFNQNFPNGTFGSTDRTRRYVGTSAGEVNGTASVKLPSTIMGAFGYDEFNISVECTADINISNTDIMFVLDTTGSMAWRPDGTNCGSAGGFWTECTGSRMSGLRSAVMTFYDTVEDATSNSAQVRYGIVPYSSSVNVGDELMAANPSWMASSHTYQSREGDYVLGPYETTSTAYYRTSGAFNWRYQGEYSETRYGWSWSQCQAAIATRYDIYYSSNSNTWTQVSQTGSNPRTTNYTGVVTYEYYWDVGNSSYRSSDGRCRIRLDHWLYDANSNIVETEEREETFEWVYKPVTFNLTSLYDDNSMQVPTGWNLGNETVTWEGCIEEASTVAVANFNPIPSGAKDLNINLVPSNDSERWKPALRNIVWMRRNGSNNYTLDEVRRTNNEPRPGYYCPEPAFRLDDLTRTELETYVNGLRPNGATYHDIGMIWGARFITPRGIFAADNATAPNGDAIARHIIFMTDGELSPSTTVYTPYGTQWWDRRIHNGTDSTQIFNNHAERFQAACRAARQENISVWVVAFGTNLTQNLIDCASPGRAFSADDSAALETTFREIAQRIAALRLTQ